MRLGRAIKPLRNFRLLISNDKTSSKCALAVLLGSQTSGRSRNNF
jgi:hypothetical protein